jgi:hypothetical protein
LILGVFLSPEGNGNAQLKLCLMSRAKELFGKIKNLSMSNKDKWMAVTMVIDPAITYPLLTTFYSPKEIDPIDSIISQMNCSALGLNSQKY